MFVVAKQDRYIRTLIRHGATSPEHAMWLGSAGGRIPRELEGLVRLGVVVEESSRRFYLDRARASTFLARRRRIALIALVIAAGAVLLVIAFSRWR